TREPAQPNGAPALPGSARPRYHARMRLAPFVASALLAGACHPPVSAEHATPTTTPAPPEKAGFVLYKFGQSIGTEHASIARGAGGSDVKTTFTFNDRGTDVPLAAKWQLLPDGTPSHYEAWGYATVVVDGDRIVAVGPRASTAVPAGARRIDVAGATIVPGLWDMHAHVEQVEQAAAYLASGVTTGRAEGNISPFIPAGRDPIAAGRGVGPRVIVDCLVGSDGRQALGTLRVNTTDDIAPLVDRFVKAGCAEVKIYSSLKPPLVAPLCAEAHRRGLGVTGHVPTGMDITDGLDAGFDGVNHIG